MPENLVQDVMDVTFGALGMGLWQRCETSTTSSSLVAATCNWRTRRYRPGGTSSRRSTRSPYGTLLGHSRPMT